MIAPAPSGRRDRTRAALIRAAETLMSAKSVDAVSIDEIVETAGVAKGTFYNHFPDKDALQHELLETIRFDITKVIAGHNAQIEDPARRVARAFCATLRYALEHPARGEFLTRASMAFRLIDERMNQGLVRDVGIGLAAGRFPIAATESGALLMMGIIHAALVQTLAHGQQFSVVARAQHLGAMLLRGLGLPHDEAERIAAQEADHIICNHDFAQAV